MRFLFSISLFSILSFAEVPSRPPAMVVVGKKGIAESVEAKELVETSSKVRPELRIVFFDSDLAPTENMPNPLDQIPPSYKVEKIVVAPDMDQATRRVLKDIDDYLGQKEISNHTYFVWAPSLTEPYKEATRSPDGTLILSASDYRKLEKARDELAFRIVGNSGRPIEVTHPPIAKKGNAGRKIMRVLYDTAVYGVSGAVGAHSLATTFSGQEFNEGSVLFGLAGAIIGGGKAVAKEIKDSGTQHGTTWVYRQQDKATVVHELDRSMGFPPGFCGDALARLNQKFL